jgi:predicted nucleic acid-binding protein
MSERFADSFVFFALLNQRDHKHAAAMAVLGNSRDRLVTTAWILMDSVRPDRERCSSR